jgi:tRNA pseudouridine(38-40) synthase
VTDDPLEAARTAFERHAWREAFEAYREAEAARSEMQQRLASLRTEQHELQRAARQNWDVRLASMQRRDPQPHKVANTGRHLVGRHDFTTFRSVQCQADNPVRTLDRLEVSRQGETIEIRASARSFLHNQVRSMVGTIKKAGEGSWTVEDVRTALAAADRAACGPVAPPDGLFLVRVDYGAGETPNSG